MDIHERYRTPSHNYVQPRFNERFLLSLTRSENCLVIDDEFNILNVFDSKALLNTESPQPEDRTALDELRDSLADSEPIGSLVKTAKTIDQATVIMQIVSCLIDREKAIFGVTASRGRGKSAALGLAVAAAVYQGYSNISVTAPSPENLSAFFEFLLTGLGNLGYKRHLDFEVVYGARELKKSVLKVDIFKGHRQTVEYITVNTVTVHADLLVIDEAAAIPLPFVKRLLGPYTVLMSSTVHGYEGTGRSLSLKLFNSLSGKNFKHLKMNEPIRYSANDPIEKWLFDLLCLEATSTVPLAGSPPHPAETSLYLVNRDTLFSYHQSAELFLHKLMSLFVSSHYKNSPNDLQMLSDAPSHMIFVLLGPIRAEASELPDILVALQVSLEGKINEERAKKQLAKGFGGTGDLIPWTVAEYYQEVNFCQLTGARVVRIATHPDVQGMGYGSRAMSELEEFFKFSLGEGDLKEPEVTVELNADEEELKPRKIVKPLLQKLSEISPPRVDYIGVAFGLNQSLYSFWRRLGFSTVYIKQKSSEITGEYSTIMLHSLNAEHDFTGFVEDFSRRFKNLLSYEFKKLPCELALQILQPAAGSDCEVGYLSSFITVYDMKRLEAFSRRNIDFHLVMDLLPVLAELYFTGKFGLEFSNLQKKILVAAALQRKDFAEIPAEIGMPISQTVLLFNKIVKILTDKVRKIYAEGVGKELPVKHLLQPSEDLTEKKFRAN